MARTDENEDANAEPRVPLLDQLDDALGGIRREMQRPSYRRRITATLDTPLEMGALRALRVIERAAEPPSVGDIAADLAIDPSAASRLVDRCVDRRLLERHAGTADRRKTRLELTERGRALLDQATGSRRGVLAEVTSGWRGSDLQQLIVLLNELRAGFVDLEERSELASASSDRS